MKVCDSDEDLTLMECAFDGDSVSVGDPDSEAVGDTLKVGDADADDVGVSGGIAAHVAAHSDNTTTRKRTERDAHVSFVCTLRG